MAVSSPQARTRSNPSAAPGGSAQHFIGGGVGKCLGQHIVLEQLIVRGDDVLDLRAVLGFLQAQRVGDGGLLCRAGIPMKIGSIQQHPSLYANLG